MFVFLKNNIINKLFRDIEPYEISMDELKQKQLNGAMIIDVRSEQEYKEGHIDGSINLPDYKINKNFYKIIQDKNLEIVLYCSSGNRSKKAYRKLTKLGYTKVFCLLGGFS